LLSLQQQVHRQVLGALRKSTQNRKVNDTSKLGRLHGSNIHNAAALACVGGGRA
jgi:hypothetical protein